MCAHWHLRSLVVLAGRRDIQALAVKCSKEDVGCEWEGTVDTFQGHVATCEFMPVPCPKQCEKYVIRRDLDTHLKIDCPFRDFECEHCGMKGTCAEIETHDEVCGKKEIPCPDTDCGASKLRRDMDEHVAKECLFTVVPCKFKDVGCDKEVRRRDLATHEQDTALHLHMALHAMMDLKTTVAESSALIGTLQTELRSANNEIQHLHDSVKNITVGMSQAKSSSVEQQAGTVSMTFTLSGYKEKKKANDMFVSPMFYTHPRGYHMAVRVYANGIGDGKGTHLAVYAPVVKGSYDAELKWPFTGEVTLTLLNQLEDKNHKTAAFVLTSKENINALRDARYGNCWGFPNFISHYDLCYGIGIKTQFVVDDTLYFRVSVTNGPGSKPGYKPWLECTTKTS